MAWPCFQRARVNSLYWIRVCVWFFCFIIHLNCVIVLPMHCGIHLQQIQKCRSSIKIPRTGNTIRPRTDYSAGQGEVNGGPFQSRANRESTTHYQLLAIIICCFIYCQAFKTWNLTSGQNHEKTRRYLLSITSMDLGKSKSRRLRGKACYTSRRIYRVHTQCIDY